MKTKKPTAAEGLLAGLTAGAAQAKTDETVTAALDRGRAVALVPFKDIRLRPLDTRTPKAEDVLAMAESVAAVGLLQPLAVDRVRRLVAGLHRLEACRVLLTFSTAGRLDCLRPLSGFEKLDPKETRRRLQALPERPDLPAPLNETFIPCRVLLDLDAEKDPGAALAAEAAENTARRQYTRKEIANLAERLKDAGYRDKPGRPRKGEKSLRPALALVLGVDVSTVRRNLNQPEKKKPAHVSGFSERAAKLEKPLADLLKAAGDLNLAANEKRIAEAAEDLLALLNQLKGN